MSMGTTVVARDLAGRLVVLHTEKHCDDLPETVPLIDEELALYLGLGDCALCFTRTRDGQSFWLDDIPDEPSTPNALALRLADASQVRVDCERVDEIRPSDVVGPPEPVAARLRAEIEAAWRGASGGDPTVGEPIPSLSVRVAALRAEAAEAERQRAAHTSALADQPVSDEEITSYLLMRAGFLLGFEGRSFAPWNDVMPDASDEDRDSYLSALNTAIGALEPRAREILLYRQISEWSDSATVADHEARFGLGIVDIVGIEETTRAALQRAGTAWRNGR
ncbi:MAG: hypothetical protein H6737_23370 [Alphaproteobacteria bacterium]|nr:hypothetical protein [Alphaproteobacteria bacterium]